MNTCYIPAAPDDSDQVSSSIDICERGIKGAYNPGLMLVILGGVGGLRYHSVLDDIRFRIPDWSVTVMLSCNPMEELDLLNEPDFAVSHIKNGIDYAQGIPFGNNKNLTFHLGSLVSKQEFVSHNREYWRSVFSERLVPRIREVSDYAKDNDIHILVESTPVPEFGDIPRSVEQYYRGVHVSDLRNPFYITSSWGFDQLRHAGTGICLDLCHSRTIYDAVSRPNDLLFEEDRSELARMSLCDDVLSLSSSDLVHLNDGRGAYSEDSVFEEGVVLGEGEIHDLDEILEVIKAREIPFVLEINETDYYSRPNTKKSIDYLFSS